MREIRSILAVFILVAGSIALVPSVAKAQGGSAKWSIGDYWEYGGAGEISGQEFTMIVRLEVKEKVTLAIETSEYESFNCTMTISATGGIISITLTSYYYFRTSDIAIVKTWQSLQIPPFLNLTMVSTYEPPQQIFQFPLDDGKNWSSTSTQNSIINGIPSTMTITNDFEVSGPSSITVPAGTFNAFTVTQTPRGGGDPGKAYYSDAVGFAVRLNGSLLGLDTEGDVDLKSFNYQSGSMSSILFLIFILVIVAVIVAVLFAIMRSRKKRRGDHVQTPSSTYGQQPQGPYQPPSQP